MATLTVRWYGHGVKAVHRNEINFLSDTIKCALLASSYTPNQTTHEWLSDVVAHEISGTGYTAGGKILANKTADYATLHVTFDADNLEWDNSTLTARYAVIYRDTGNPATSPLLGYGTGGADESSEGASFFVNWHANGILRTTAS